MWIENDAPGFRRVIVFDDRLTGSKRRGCLNCQPYDVPILVAARLLRPLGNPQPNSVKYFASVEVLELAKDRAWLAKMTNAVN